MAGSLVFQELLAEKILVRNFSNHPALPGGIRLTIGTEDENIKIAATLAAICQRAGE
jgi:Histidinol-phosphate/aromatic aminotransferase and cobyric acid decarboxylase